MEKLKELNELKHDLIEAAKAEMAKGIENVPTEEMGEVVDMIKDLASAEKDCMEAAYYETVTDAMTDGDERMGYDRWRYASGRFAPKGRGTYGYMPPVMDGNEYPTEYPAPRMGYNPRMGNTDKVDSAFETMSAVWADADTETRKKMKRLVGDLYDEMEQSGV